jgi:opacity protein-like surface antigen
MRILSSVVLAAGLFTAGSAMAQDPILDKTYLRLDSGASFARNPGDNYSTDPGAAAIIGGGVGYRVNNHIRTDVTITHRTNYTVKAAGTDPNTTDALNAKANVRSTTAMANVYYDIAKLNRFTPYVGAGAGASYNSTSSVQKFINGGLVGEDSSATTTQPAWQVSAGTSVAITQNVSADVGYRYQDLGKIKVNTDMTPYGESGALTGGKTNLSAHEVQAGVRYNF